ncbi:hypothetical protein QEH52_15020 [Coraliomargarita sp. SDUM461003]|uniref:Glycosyltransferase RgtA/B/C/D-like domain-containing protein n=1 Tax=Thalassobacterium maritimum TaxID=3041265 RepID=A0ABU1B0N8_9BACT|nr:hypothetical protein [Coraliomargarita sp. SDUM461003]MDQ8208837.1 hypothetical protein [Coraliomargarita sp. SDUM461003]
MKSSSGYSTLLLPGQLRLILAISLVHIVVWFSYYSQLPAGQYLGTEARDTLEAAQALAIGLPTQDSAHTLYTYILSFLARFFESDQNLITAARVLNASALILTTGYCASAAGRYWRRNRTVWIAGLLVGLNPVLVFWAGQISPSLLATACISIALWRAQRWLRRPKIRDSIGVSIFLTLSAALETSLLPLTLIWPVLAYFYPYRKRVQHCTLAWLPTALLLGLILVSSWQLESPLQWHFKQIGVGIYQALGNLEGYDGKSFALYRELHLILLFNPIHWGLLFILAGMGMYARLKDGHRGDYILLAISTLAIFAISSGLNEAGSQARATMIPLLAIFASGASMLPKIWRKASTRTRRKIQVGVVLLALFVYAGHFLQDQSQTWERDYTYLAEANIQLGNNDRATTWAEKALELSPANQKMQEVIAMAQFNDWAMGTRQRGLLIEDIQDYLKNSQVQEATATTQTIYAIYKYKLRDLEAAVTIWELQQENSALARLCLYWTGQILEVTPGQLKSHTGQPYYDLLKAATKVDRNELDYGKTEKQLDNILAFAY